MKGVSKVLEVQELSETSEAQELVQKPWKCGNILENSEAWE